MKKNYTRKPLLSLLGLSVLHSSHSLSSSHWSPKKAAQQGSILNPIELTLPEVVHDNVKKKYFTLKNAFYDCETNEQHVFLTDGNQQYISYSVEEFSALDAKRNPRFALTIHPKRSKSWIKLNLPYYYFIITPQKTDEEHHERAVLIRLGIDWSQLLQHIKAARINHSTTNESSCSES